MIVVPLPFGLLVTTKFTKWSSLSLEIRSSNFEIRNKFKILISKSRKCTAGTLARFEFSIRDIWHCFGFRASDFEFCLGGFLAISSRRCLWGGRAVETRAACEDSPGPGLVASWISSLGRSGRICLYLRE